MMYPSYWVGWRCIKSACRRFHLAKNRKREQGLRSSDVDRQSVGKRIYILSSIHCEKLNPTRVEVCVLAIDLRSPFFGFSFFGFSFFFSLLFLLSFPHFLWPTHERLHTVSDFSLLLGETWRRFRQKDHVEREFKDVVWYQQVRGTEAREEVCRAWAMNVVAASQTFQGSPSHVLVYFE